MVCNLLIGKKFATYLVIPKAIRKNIRYMKIEYYKNSNNPKRSWKGKRENNY